MPKSIYNEGRVVGLSAYEIYARNKLADDPNAIVASEREWLASTLGMGSSMLLRVNKTYVQSHKVVANGTTYYCDFPLPPQSSLGAAGTIVASFFNGTGDNGLKDKTPTIVNNSTVAGEGGTYTISIANTPMKGKTTVTIKIGGSGGQTLTLKDGNNTLGKLSADTFVRLTNQISTEGPYIATYDKDAGEQKWLKNFAMPSGFAAVPNTAIKLNLESRVDGEDPVYITCSTFSEGGGFILKDDVSGNAVASIITKTDKGVSIVDRLDPIVDYSEYYVTRISFQVYLDVYMTGEVDFDQKKIRIYPDFNRTTFPNGTNEASAHGVQYSSNRLGDIASFQTPSTSYYYYSEAASASGLWSTRVTSYGGLLGNINSTISPNDSTNNYPINPNALAKLTSDSQEMRKMMQYLKIVDGIIVQPGDWEHVSGIDLPYKDEHWDASPEKLSKPSFIRLFFASEPFPSSVTTISDFYILLTGFMDKYVVEGTSSLMSSIQTASPENGDFLGPACYPWASKIVITTPTELTYYLKNSIKSGSQNVEIIQDDESPDVAIKVRNDIDRGTKSGMGNMAKKSANFDNLQDGYTGLNVFVAQSDNEAWPTGGGRGYPDTTRIGVKNIISKAGSASGIQGKDSSGNNVDYAGRNLYIAQQGDGATTQIGVKNEITTGVILPKNESDSYFNTCLVPTQKNDCANTLLQVNPFAIAKRGLIHGIGINISAETDISGNYRMKIENTLPNYGSGNWVTVHEDCYDEAWYNSFYSGPSQQYYTDIDHVPDKGKLLVQVQLSTKKDSNGNTVIDGGAMKIHTNVSAGKALKHAGRINTIVIRHANTWDHFEPANAASSGAVIESTMYDSWITKIKFKNVPLKNSDGNPIAGGVSASVLNTVRICTNTTPDASGIWNLHKYVGSGTPGDQSGASYKSNWKSCGASWHANCPITYLNHDDVTVPKEAGKTWSQSGKITLGAGDGFLITISQYADGYNNQIATSVDDINLYTWTNINLEATCTFKS